MKLEKYPKQTWFRLIALTLCVSLVWTDISLSAPLEARPSGTSAPIASPKDIVIPSELGIVQEYFQGQGSKLIIHLQDAHSSVETQEALAALVKYFHEKYGIKQAFVEGGEGELAMNEARTFPDPEIRKKVAREFLRTWQITGPEYYIISENPEFSLIGVESLKQYYANREQFSEALKLGKSLDDEFRLFRTDIENLKSKILNPELREFVQWQEKLEKILQSPLLLADYLRYLKGCHEAHFPAEPFAVSYPSIAKAVSPDKKIEAENISIDFAQIFKELESLKSKISNALIVNENEKILLELLHILSYIEGALHLTLSRTDFEDLEKNPSSATAEFVRNELSSLNASHIWKPEFETLFEGIKPAFNFYRGARGRDEVFIEKMEKEFRHKERQQSLLITGGFHTSGITARLREKNISYVVIQPAIKEHKPEDLKKYRETSLPAVTNASKSNIPLEVAFGSSNDTGAAKRRDAFYQAASYWLIKDFIDGRRIEPPQAKQIEALLAGFGAEHSAAIKSNKIQAFKNKGMNQWKKASQRWILRIWLSIALMDLTRPFGSISMPMKSGFGNRFFAMVNHRFDEMATKLIEKLQEKKVNLNSGRKSWQVRLLWLLAQWKFYNAERILFRSKTVRRYARGKTRPVLVAFFVDSLASLGGSNTHAEAFGANALLWPSAKNYQLAIIQTRGSRLEGLHKKLASDGRPVFSHVDLAVNDLDGFISAAEEAIRKGEVRWDMKPPVDVVIAGRFAKSRQIIDRDTNTRVVLMQYTNPPSVGFGAEAPAELARANFDALRRQLFAAPDGKNRQEIEKMMREFIAVAFKHLFGVNLGAPPVFPQSPETLRAKFEGRPLPRDGIPYGDVLDRYEDEIHRFAVNLGNPQYAAHLTPPPLAVAIATDLLIAAVNANLIAWEASPAATFAQMESVRWLSEIVGYDSKKAGGSIVAGGTLANMTAFIVATRDTLRKRFEAAGISSDKIPNVAKVGLIEIARELQKVDKKFSGKFVIITSEAAHYSHKKIGGYIGLGSDNIETVSTVDGRMDTADLERKIAEHKKHGDIVLAIVSTASTTEQGKFDPFREIAEIAKRYGIWFHVDAAHGGAVKLSEKYKHLADGMELADSITIDPHKWFYLPYAVGAILFKEAANLGYMEIAASYAFKAGEGAGAGVVSLGKTTIQGSARFEALKLWFALQTIGVKNYGLLIDHTIDETKRIAEWVNEQDDFELISKPEVNQFDFRFVPQDLRVQLEKAKSAGDFKELERLNQYLNELNRQLSNRLMERGLWFFSRTTLGKTEYSSPENFPANNNLEVFVNVNMNVFVEQEILASAFNQVAEVGYELYMAEDFQRDHPVESLIERQQMDMLAILLLGQGDSADLNYYLTLLDAHFDFFVATATLAKRYPQELGLGASFKNKTDELQKLLKEEIPVQYAKLVEKVKDYAGGQMTPQDLPEVLALRTAYMDLLTRLEGLLDEAIALHQKMEDANRSGAFDPILPILDPVQDDMKSLLDRTVFLVRAVKAFLSDDLASQMEEVDLNDWLGKTTPQMEKAVWPERTFRVVAYRDMDEIPPVRISKPLLQMAIERLLQRAHYITGMTQGPAFPGMKDEREVRIMAARKGEEEPELLGRPQIKILFPGIISREEFLMWQSARPGDPRFKRIADLVFAVKALKKMGAEIRLKHFGVLGGQNLEHTSIIISFPKAADVRSVWLRAKKTARGSEVVREKALTQAAFWRFIILFVPAAAFIVNILTGFRALKSGWSAGNIVSIVGLTVTAILAILGYRYFGAKARQLLKIFEDIDKVKEADHHQELVINEMWQVLVQIKNLSRHDFALLGLLTYQDALNRLEEIKDREGGKAHKASPIFDREAGKIRRAIKEELRFRMIPGISDMIRLAQEEISTELLIQEKLIDGSSFRPAALNMHIAMVMINVLDQILNMDPNQWTWKEYDRIFSEHLTQSLGKDSEALRTTLTVALMKYGWLPNLPSGFGNESAPKKSASFSWTELLRGWRPLAFGLVALGTLYVSQSDFRCAGIVGGFSVIIGAFARWAIGNPNEKTTARWSKQLLNVAIIFLGAGLNVDQIWQLIGFSGILGTAVVVSTTFLVGLGLAKLFKTDWIFSVLFITGMSICGGSAILATSMALGLQPDKNNEHQKSQSSALAIILVLNTLALWIFPFIAHQFHLLPSQAAYLFAWAIQDTNSVVESAHLFDLQSVELATTLKVMRASLIMLTTLFISLNAHRLDRFLNGGSRAPSAEERVSKSWRLPPPFIFGFILAAALTTFIPPLQPLGNDLKKLSKPLLTMAFFFVGSGFKLETFKKILDKRILAQSILAWFLLVGPVLAYVIHLGAATPAGNTNHVIESDSARKEMPVPTLPENLTGGAGFGATSADDFRDFIHRVHSQVGFSALEGLHHKAYSEVTLRNHLDYVDDIANLLAMIRNFARSARVVGVRIYNGVDRGTAVRINNTGAKTEYQVENQTPLSIGDQQALIRDEIWNADPYWQAPAGETLPATMVGPAPPRAPPPSPSSAVSQGNPTSVSQPAIAKLTDRQKQIISEISWWGPTDAVRTKKPAKVGLAEFVETHRANGAKRFKLVANIPSPLFQYPKDPRIQAQPNIVSYPQSGVDVEILEIRKDDVIFKFVPTDANDPRTYNPRQISIKELKQVKSNASGFGAINTFFGVSGADNYLEREIREAGFTPIYANQLERDGFALLEKFRSITVASEDKVRLYSFRHEERYMIEAPANPPLLRMDPFAFEVLLENVSMRSRAGKVEIRFGIDGERLTLDVIDDGIGIPKEIRERIFEWGFTTHPRGGGGGLGLPIAKREAERHNGRIFLFDSLTAKEFSKLTSEALQLRTKEGKLTHTGSIFRFEFPLNEILLTQSNRQSDIENAKRNEKQLRELQQENLIVDLTMDDLHALGRYFESHFDDLMVEWHVESESKPDFYTAAEEAAALLRNDPTQIVALHKTVDSLKRGVPPIQLSIYLVKPEKGFGAENEDQKPMDETMAIFPHREAEGQTIYGRFDVHRGSFAKTTAATGDGTNRTIDFEKILAELNTAELPILVLFENNGFRFSLNPRFYNPLYGHPKDESALSEIVRRLNEVLNQEKFRTLLFQELKMDGTQIAVWLESIFDQDAVSDLILAMQHTLFEGIPTALSEAILNYLQDMVAYTAKSFSAKDLELQNKYLKYAREAFLSEKPHRKFTLLNLEDPKNFSVFAMGEPGSDNPEAMVIESLHRLERGRPVPATLRADLKVEETLQPEKVIFARWKGRIFFFYTSRSHWLRDAEVHMWRQTDFKMNANWFRGFDKKTPENLDDLPPRLSILLDQAVDRGLRSGKLSEKSHDEFDMSVKKLGLYVTSKTLGLESELDKIYAAQTLAEVESYASNAKNRLYLKNAQIKQAIAQKRLEMEDATRGFGSTAPAEFHFEKLGDVFYPSFIHPETGEAVHPFLLSHPNEKLSIEARSEIHLEKQGVSRIANDPADLQKIIESTLRYSVKHSIQQDVPPPPFAALFNDLIRWFDVHLSPDLKTQLVTQFNETAFRLGFLEGDVTMLSQLGMNALLFIVILLRLKMTAFSSVAEGKKLVIFAEDAPSFILKTGDGHEFLAVSMWELGRFVKRTDTDQRPQSMSGRGFGTEENETVKRIKRFSVEWQKLAGEFKKRSGPADDAAVRLLRMIFLDEKLPEKPREILPKPPHESYSLEKILSNVVTSLIVDYPGIQFEMVEKDEEGVSEIIKKRFHHYDLRVVAASLSKDGKPSKPLRLIRNLDSILSSTPSVSANPGELISLEDAFLKSINEADLIGKLRAAKKAKSKTKASSTAKSDHEAIRTYSQYLQSNDQRHATEIFLDQDECQPYDEFINALDDLFTEKLGKQIPHFVENLIFELHHRPNRDKYIRQELSKISKKIPKFSKVLRLLVRDMLVFAETAYTQDSEDARIFLWKMGEIAAQVEVQTQKQHAKYHKYHEDKFFEEEFPSFVKDDNPELYSHPFLILGPGPATLYLLKNLKHGKYVLADRSYFVEAYLSKAKELLDVGDDVVVRRVDMRDADKLFLEGPYRNVFMRNVLNYAGELPRHWVARLLDEVVPGGEIVYGHRWEDEKSPQESSAEPKVVTPEPPPVPKKRPDKVNWLAVANGLIHLKIMENLSGQGKENATWQVREGFLPTDDQGWKQEYIVYTKLPGEKQSKTMELTHVEQEARISWQIRLPEISDETLAGWLDSVKLNETEVGRIVSALREHEPYDKIPLKDGHYVVLRPASARNFAEKFNPEFEIGGWHYRLGGEDKKILVSKPDGPSFETDDKEIRSYLELKLFEQIHSIALRILHPETRAAIIFDRDISRVMTGREDENQKTEYFERLFNLTGTMSPHRMFAINEDRIARGEDQTGYQMGLFNRRSGRFKALIKPSFHLDVSSDSLFEALTRLEAKWALALAKIESDPVRKGMPVLSLPANLHSAGFGVDSREHEWTQPDDPAGPVTPGGRPVIQREKFESPRAQPFYQTFLDAGIKLTKQIGQGRFAKTFTFKANLAKLNIPNLVGWITVVPVNPSLTSPITGRLDFVFPGGPLVMRIASRGLIEDPDDIIRQSQELTEHGSVARLFWAGIVGTTASYVFHMSERVGPVRGLTIDELLENPRMYRYLYGNNHDLLMFAGGDLLMGIQEFEREGLPHGDLFGNVMITDKGRLKLLRDRVEGHPDTFPGPAGPQLPLFVPHASISISAYRRLTMEQKIALDRQQAALILIALFGHVRWKVLQEATKEGERPPLERVLAHNNKNFLSNNFGEKSELRRLRHFIVMLYYNQFPDWDAILKAYEEITDPKKTKVIWPRPERRFAEVMVGGGRIFPVDAKDQSPVSGFGAAREGEVQKAVKFLEHEALWNRAVDETLLEGLQARQAGTPVDEKWLVQKFLTKVRALAPPEEERQILANLAKVYGDADIDSEIYINADPRKRLLYLASREIYDSLPLDVSETQISQEEKQPKSPLMPTRRTILKILGSIITKSVIGTTELGASAVTIAEELHSQRLVASLIDHIALGAKTYGEGRVMELLHVHSPFRSVLWPDAIREERNFGIFERDTSEPARETSWAKARVIFYLQHRIFPEILKRDVRTWAKENAGEIAKLWHSMPAYMATVHPDVTDPKEFQSMMIDEFQRHFIIAGREEYDSLGARNPLASFQLLKQNWEVKFRMMEKKILSLSEKVAEEMADRLVPKIETGDVKIPFERELKGKKQRLSEAKKELRKTEQSIEILQIDRRMWESEKIWSITKRDQEIYDRRESLEREVEHLAEEIETLEMLSEIFRGEGKEKARILPPLSLLGIKSPQYPQLIISAAVAVGAGMAAHSLFSSERKAGFGVEGSSELEINQQGKRLLALAGSARANNRFEEALSQSQEADEVFAKLRSPWSILGAAVEQLNFYRTFSYQAIDKGKSDLAFSIFTGRVSNITQRSKAALLDYQTRMKKEYKEGQLTDAIRYMITTHAVFVRKVREQNGNLDLQKIYDLGMELSALFPKEPLVQAKAIDLEEAFTAPIQPPKALPVERIAKPPVANQKTPVPVTAAKPENLPSPARKPEAPHDLEWDALLMEIKNASHHRLGEIEQENRHLEAQKQAALQTAIERRREVLRFQAAGVSAYGAVKEKKSHGPIGHVSKPSDKLGKKSVPELERAALDGNAYALDKLIAWAQKGNPSAIGSLGRLTKAGNEKATGALEGLVRKGNKEATRVSDSLKKSSKGKQSGFGAEQPQTSELVQIPDRVKNILQFMREEGDLESLLKEAMADSGNRSHDGLLEEIMSDDFGQRVWARYLRNVQTAPKYYYFLLAKALRQTRNYFAQQDKSFLRVTKALGQAAELADAVIKIINDENLSYEALISSLPYYRQSAVRKLPEEKVKAFLVQLASYYKLEIEFFTPDLVFRPESGMVFNYGGKPYVFLSNFSSKHGRGERIREAKFNRDWFRARGYEVIETPPKFPFESADVKFVKHGHSVTIIFGWGFRTSKSSVQWITNRIKRIVGRKVFAKKFKIIFAEEITEDAYHIDTALKEIPVIKNGKIVDETIMYHPAAFSKETREVLRRHFPSAVILSDVDAKNFAANSVTIDKNVIMDDRVSAELETELTGRGMKVVRINLFEFYRAGGGSKCLVLELDRNPFSLDIKHNKFFQLLESPQGIFGVESVYNPFMIGQIGAINKAEANRQHAHLVKIMQELGGEIDFFETEHFKASYDAQTLYGTIFSVLTGPGIPAEQRERMKKIVKFLHGYAGLGKWLGFYLEDDISIDSVHFTGTLRGHFSDLEIELLGGPQKINDFMKFVKKIYLRHYDSSPEISYSTLMASIYEEVASRVLLLPDLVLPKNGQAYPVLMKLNKDKPLAVIELSGDQDTVYRQLVERLSTLKQEDSEQYVLVSASVSQSINGHESIVHSVAVDKVKDFLGARSLNYGGKKIRVEDITKHFIKGRIGLNDFLVHYSILEFTKRRHIHLLNISVGRANRSDDERHSAKWQRRKIGSEIYGRVAHLLKSRFYGWNISTFIQTEQPSRAWFETHFEARELKARDIENLSEMFSIIPGQVSQILVGRIPKKPVTARKISTGFGAMIDWAAPPKTMKEALKIAGATYRTTPGMSELASTKAHEATLLAEIRETAAKAPKDKPVMLLGAGPVSVPYIKALLEFDFPYIVVADIAPEAIVNELLTAGVSEKLIGLHEDSDRKIRILQADLSLIPDSFYEEIDRAVDSAASREKAFEALEDVFSRSPQAWDYYSNIPQNILRHGGAHTYGLVISALLQNVFGDAFEQALRLRVEAAFRGANGNGDWTRLRPDLVYQKHRIAFEWLNWMYLQDFLLYSHVHLLRELLAEDGLGYFASRVYHYFNPEDFITLAGRRPNLGLKGRTEFADALKLISSGGDEYTELRRFVFNLAEQEEGGLKALYGRRSPLMKTELKLDWLFHSDSKSPWSNRFDVEPKNIWAWYHNPHFPDWAYTVESIVLRPRAAGFGTMDRIGLVFKDEQLKQFFEQREFRAKASALLRAAIMPGIFYGRRLMMRKLEENLVSVFDEHELNSYLNGLELSNNLKGFIKAAYFVASSHRGAVSRLFIEAFEDRLLRAHLEKYSPDTQVMIRAVLASASVISGVKMIDVLSMYKESESTIDLGLTGLTQSGPGENEVHKIVKAILLAAALTSGRSVNEIRAKMITMKMSKKWFEIEHSPAEKLLLRAFFAWTAAQLPSEPLVKRKQIAERSKDLPKAPAAGAKTFLQSVYRTHRSFREAGDMMDQFGIKAGDKILAVGPGYDYPPLVAAAIVGANIDVVQPEVHVPDIGAPDVQNAFLKDGIESARASILKAKGNDFIGERIDLNQFPVEIENARLPHDHYNTVFLFNVLDDPRMDIHREAIFRKIRQATQGRVVLLLSSSTKPFDTVLTIIKKHLEPAGIRVTVTGKQYARTSDAVVYEIILEKTGIGSGFGAESLLNQELARLPSVGSTILITSHHDEYIKSIASMPAKLRRKIFNEIQNIIVVMPDNSESAEALGRELASRLGLTRGKTHILGLGNASELESEVVLQLLKQDLFHFGDENDLPEGLRFLASGPNTKVVQWIDWASKVQRQVRMAA